MPGMVTPATIGWNIVSSSCRPRKYHGAFDGFGVWLTSARPSSGAFTNAEKIEHERGQRERRRRTRRRAGAATTCTLSCGVGLASAGSSRT